jgi:hypothetical protein
MTVSQNNSAKQKELIELICGKYGEIIRTLDPQPYCPQQNFAIECMRGWMVVGRMALGRGTFGRSGRRLNHI